MRGISFVVFIRRIYKIDYQIINDKSGSVSVDKKFLPASVQRNIHSMRKPPEIWLWHLPCDVDEEKIKTHFCKTGLWKTDMEVIKLHDKNGKFAGFKIGHPERFDLQKYVDAKKMPPGWSMKYFKSMIALNAESESRSFEIALSPTCLTMQTISGSEVETEDVKKYINTMVRSVFYKSRLNFWFN